MSIAANIAEIKRELGQVHLVAVSKYSSDAAVQEAYAAGHRDFGENKAQDLIARAERLPSDIRWHFIGHLQRNKVKYIAAVVHLIHSVDSLRLLKEINKQAAIAGRTIPCLLQVHIAQEEAKFGLSITEASDLACDPAVASMEHIRIEGLMGMATLTEDVQQIEREFASLSQLYASLSRAATPANVRMNVLSMGMSSDYRIAVRQGSNLVRIGSAIFK